MSMLGRQSPDERDERLGGSRMAAPATREQNIYIPQFITKRPFYAIDEEDEGGASSSKSAVARVGGAGPEADAARAAAAAAGTTGQRDYLEHQRLRKREEETAWYQRGRKAGPAATKYRKGACENCGSMGHKMRDCLSRPRARLAKHTGADIQADELVQDVRLGWDAKRDRWLGFDARDYAAMVARREKMNEARRRLGGGGEGAEGGGGEGTGSGNGNEGNDGNDTRYSEDADMGVSRTNGAADLRMREDTARYLVNLDPDSAKYDPKRRKVVDGGAFLDESARLFAEQNFARASGEAAAFARDERYAWELHDQTGDASLHLQANPTAAAHRRRLEADADAEKREAMAALMREKYGVEMDDKEKDKDGDKDGDGKTSKTIQSGTKKMLSAAPVAASEHFVEYDEAGHVKERLRAPRAEYSKYAEDVLPMNHTAVWGSWWHDFRWGYACCHSFVRNSYCTGDEGKAAWERAERQRLGDWGGEGEGDEGEDGDDSDRDGKGNGNPRRRLLLKAQGEDEDGHGRDGARDRRDREGE